MKIDIFLEVKKESERAFLVTDMDSNDPNDFEWIPKSQLEYDEDIGEGDSGVFRMPEWLAKDKGFI